MIPYDMHRRRDNGNRYMEEDESQGDSEVQEKWD